MSMFESLGRFGTAIKHAHNREQVRPGPEQPTARNSEGHRLASVAARRPAGHLLGPASGFGALMTFADKCKLLAKRRSRHTAPAASDPRLRAALLHRR
ncbi:hypothetical protein [Mesorhizobium sp. BHbdii]